MTLRLSRRSPALTIAFAASLMAAGCASQEEALQMGAGLDAGAGLGAGAGVAAPGSPQDFQVNVGDRVFFTVDSSTLTPEARATLDRQAMWLNQYPRYAFMVEGHADERGTREYNLALGARRAAAVREYLAARGVNPGRMRTISYGKERPVAVCDAPDCWNQNRRAVTALGGVSS